MKITELKVDGFGIWSGLELSELSDQLNVFYGANEAGKTTLMQFVRSLFYGFSPERRARYLPPLRPGRPGGEIRAAAGQKLYAISRHADEPGEIGDVATVNDGHQSVRDERALSALLGEIDEPIFNNVFAFGLREIQELGTLSDTQAADELYSLALGVDRVSLVDVLGELETSRNRLLAADDRPSLVTQLLSQRERLQAEIDDLGQSTARYLTLLSERQKLAGEIQRLQSDSEQFEHQGRELALARALGDRWQRRAVIDQHLTGLVGFGTLPENALARFERVQARLQVFRRRLKRIKQHRRALLAQIQQLNINEGLCRQALRLEALGEQQHWIESLESQVSELENEILELESHRETSSKQLGIAHHLAAEPLSKRALGQLRDAAQTMRAARHDLGQFRQQITTAEQTADHHHQQLQSTLGEKKGKGLTQSLSDAGELVSQLRKRVQVDEKLDQMTRRQTELEEQSHEQLDRQLLPAWILAGLGCLFVLGCALVLLYVAGLILPESLSASLHWPVGLIGAGAMAAAAVMKVGMERLAVLQLDSCHQQAQSLKQQIEQAKTERDELDAHLPRGGGPLVARMQAAEKELARLEGLLPLQSQHETAKRQADTAKQQEETLRTAYRQQRKVWRRLLGENGLPADLAPHQLRDFTRRRDRVRGLSRALDDKHNDLDRRRAEYKVLASRVAQLVAEVGITPRGQRPIEQLRQCLVELKEQQSKIKQREAYVEQLAKLKRRHARCKQTADKFRQRRQTLLRSAGTHDEQEFRRRAAVQAEAGRLQSERAQLAHEIATSLAGHSSEPRLAELFASPHGLEQLETQVSEVRQKTTAQLNEALGRRGEMAQQLKSLVEDRQLAHKHIELSMVEKRLHDALDRWRVLSVCGMMLEAVRQYYEREHQPQALREASLYLQRLTGGRYTRVWTPLGDKTLRVDDRQGQSLRVEVLSRGTREQLFLALRLALVSSYARRGVNLPLVLDDVLVNFDIARAKAAAIVLRDFARQGQQILIFTCHEHIAKLFKNIKAEVRQLPDHENPHGENLLGAIDEASARRARRTRPEIPLEPEPIDEPEDDPDVLPPVEEPEPEAEIIVAAASPPPAPVLPAAIEPTPKPTPLPVPVAPPVPVAISPPPEPARARPARQPRRKIERRTERVEWSAEEFEGELADRVRKTITREDEADDAEAA